MEILHSFGNYSIRYLPMQKDGTQGGNNKFIIPETNITNHRRETTQVIHGDRSFTRQIWADICRSLAGGSRNYKGVKLEKAALVYGGELKCPGRHMQSDGTWFERSEAAFKYETVDGGTICEHFTGGADPIFIWDPEPKPEPVVTAAEPETPPEVMAGLGIPSEAELDQMPEPDTEKLSLQEENASLKAELEALLAKPVKPAKGNKPDKSPKLNPQK